MVPNGDQRLDYSAAEITRNDAHTVKTENLARKVLRHKFKIYPRRNENNELSKSY